VWGASRLGAGQSGAARPALPDIDEAAATQDLPPTLLATVVLNELADYGWTRSKATAADRFGRVGDRATPAIRSASLS
jgi:hypothetical protein